MVRFAMRIWDAKTQGMNNLKLRILERAHAHPSFTMGGLADRIGRSPATEKAVLELVEKGYLRNDYGLELSAKGMACIDSSSFRNRAKRVGTWVLGIAASVAAVVMGNLLWGLMQSSL